MQDNAHIEGDARELERQFRDSTLEWRRLAAEGWGTFLLVLVACGADVASSLTHGELSRPLAAALPGGMVTSAIYFMGAVSGARLNPAVTLAFALRRNFPWNRVPGYILVQCAGALGAIVFLKAIFSNAAELGATTPRGTPLGAAIALETILTAGLVSTILGTASGARNIGANAGIAVGSYIALAGMWASSFTGASMNPARSLAPDIVRADFSTTLVYLI